MSFLRRLLGGGAKADEANTGTRETGQGAAAGSTAADQSGLDEIERDRELMRAEAFRLSDDLIQRQLRYASRSWTPPAQGGTRRADDGEGDDSPG